MKRLIRVKCVQNLLRRDSKNCSFSSKHIAVRLLRLVRLVPLLEQEMASWGAESSALEGIPAQCGIRLGALVANCSSCGLAGNVLWALA